MRNIRGILVESLEELIEYLLNILLDEQLDDYDFLLEDISYEIIFEQLEEILHKWLDPDLW